jgi:sugar phosphate isomerase/epimerase
VTEEWIDRRTLIGMIAAAGSLAVDSTALAAKPRDNRRIGFTTVSIRDRIPFHIPGMPPQAGKMSLLDAPRFAVDVVGLRNLEVWSLQFEDTSEDYCRRLHSAAASAGVTLTNLQYDDLSDLGSADAAMRAQAVDKARGWIDRATWIGAKSIRVNFSGMRPTTPFVVGPVAEGLRTLADYGQTKGLLVLTENHIGHSIAIDNVVAALKGADHPNLKLEFDWGNVADADTASVIAAVSALKPWLHLVSAKASTFDDAYVATTYDVGAIVAATERAGYRGLYSIELFGPTPSGFDSVKAMDAMRTTIADGLRA